MSDDSVSILRDTQESFPPLSKGETSRNRECQAGEKNGKMKNRCKKEATDRQANEFLRPNQILLLSA